MWSCEERVFKYKGRPFFRSYSPPAHWHIQPFNTPLLSSTCLSYTLPLSDFKSVQACLLQPLQSLPTLLLQPSLLQAKNWISAYLKGSYFRPFKRHLKPGHPPLKLRLFLTPGSLTTQSNPTDTLPTVYLFSIPVIIKRVVSQIHHPIWAGHGLLQIQTRDYWAHGQLPTVSWTWSLRRFLPAVTAPLRSPG